MTKKSQEAESDFRLVKEEFLSYGLLFLKKKYTSTERQHPAINQTAGDHAYASKDYFHHPGSRQSRYQ